MEDYDRYMDERGHEACAQMLARNSARDGAESLPAFHISEDGMCARVEVDLLAHASAAIAHKIAKMGEAAFDEELRAMGYVRIDAKSRYAELFGTPGRAARTLAGICESCKCGDCATCGVPEWADYSHDYDALLEWLMGDAR